jgi:hypothetical protein
VSGLTRLLAIALLAGTALLGVGAVMHPMLAGDAGAQLRTIASTPYWRPLHLAMLAGSALVIAGVWVRLVTDRGAVKGALVAALAVIVLGVALNALNIAYMAGTGWHLATLFDASRADTRVLFDATHLVGLMAARFGNLLAALGALMLGTVERREPGQPLWLAALAWLAAAGGLVGVVFFDETSRMALAAVALLSGWQVATALRSLRAARA